MPGPGLEGHEPVRLGGGGVHDLPDVDPHAVAEHRQLVDERDVDRAEDVLEQLAQLRRLGGGDRDDLVADDLVELDRAPQAFGRQPADDLRRVAQREVGASRVDRARARRPRRSRGRRPGPTPRAAARGAPAERPGIGGRLEHDQLALLEHVRQRGAGVRRAAGDPARGCGVSGVGTRHDHRLDLARARRSAWWGGSDRPRRRAPRRARPRCGSGPRARASTTRASVSTPSHLVAGLAEGDDQRQPDVAEPDDPELS